jgi:hypothetical protein
LFGGWVRPRGGGRVPCPAVVCAAMWRCRSVLVEGAAFRKHNGVITPAAVEGAAII